VIGKNGPKFPEIKPGEPTPALAPMKDGNVARMMARNLTALADMLSSPNLMGRPVLDKTGLTGNYLIDLQYGPSDDLVTVILDQGLKLESVKGTIEMLVVDRVERPDPN
jgi:uncharacterized protein (TIGR03435 family)